MKTYVSMQSMHLSPCLFPGPKLSVSVEKETLCTSWLYPTALVWLLQCLQGTGASLPLNSGFLDSQRRSCYNPSHCVLRPSPSCLPFLWKPPGLQRFPHPEDAQICGAPTSPSARCSLPQFLTEVSTRRYPLFFLTSTLCDLVGPYDLSLLQTNTSHLRSQGPLECHNQEPSGSP